MKELRVTGYLLHTSYELLLLYELQLTFTLQVTSFFLHISDKLQFIAGVTSFFLHKNHELLLIARVTSYFLHKSYELLSLHKLRVTILHTSYELLFIARFTFLKVFCFILHSPVFNIKYILENWFAEILQNNSKTTEVKMTLARKAHNLKVNWTRF